jgi:hypothetical protein
VLRYDAFGDDFGDLNDLFPVYDDGNLDEPAALGKSVPQIREGAADLLSPFSSSSAPSDNEKRKGDHVATEDCEPDSKRQQRLVRNRNSAALSRWRKRSSMEALERRNMELERSNARLNYLLASASLENQTLRAAMQRDGLDTVNEHKGMSIVGEPAVLSKGDSQPMYAERLQKHDSLQMECQQFPCATANHTRRAHHVALLFFLLHQHLQHCPCLVWSDDGLDRLSLVPSGRRGVSGTRVRPSHGRHAATFPTHSFRSRMPKRRRAVSTTRVNRGALRKRSRIA